MAFMALTAESVLGYLSRQKFGVYSPELHRDFSLIEWNKVQMDRTLKFNELSGALGIETEGRKRTIIVRPFYQDFVREEYSCKLGGLGQLFSGLELSAGRDGSLTVISFLPMPFSKKPWEYQFGDDKHYYQIKLLRTKKD